MFLIGREEGLPAASQDFTLRTKQVLILASEEAQRVGETAISPCHILIALMREGQGIAAQMLHTEEEAITLPADFQAALQQHPAANTFFAKLSYSKQKIFIDHIEQVEGEAARSQRVQQIIEQLEKIYQAHQA